MEKKRLSGNAKCPCKSGRLYRNCCWHKGFEWHVDAKGRHYRVVPVHPEVRKMIEAEEDWFESSFGRKPGKHDWLIFDRMRAGYLDREMAKVMFKAGVSPELIYANQKTGLIVTEKNQYLFTDLDLQEWDNSIKEFRNFVSKQPDDLGEPSNTIHDLFLGLDTALSSSIRILGRIIQEHGIARNLKSRSKVHVHHDFLFLCYTKTLKTLRAIKALLEDGYGEDALSLSRAVFETYLTIAYLVKQPDRINLLVVAPIRFAAGLCEKITEQNGTKKRKVLRACLKNNFKQMFVCTFVPRSGRNSAWRVIQVV